MRLRATKLAAIRFGGTRFPLASLDLQFATDRTLAARRGPTPTFTRSTSATEVSATGLVEYAPENLILSSNNIVSPVWTKEGGTAAVSVETVNGLTASVFNEDATNTNHRFFRVNDGLAHIASTFSLWLKPAGRRYVCVNLGSNGPTAFSKLVLDLVDQVVIVSSAGVTTNIQTEANGWARYSFTFVPRNDSGTMPIQSNFSSTALSETGVGLNGAAFYVAGQQYERASTAGAYLPTTTTAAYSPRFDYNPTTLASLGLLIEESRFNYTKRSYNSFQNAYWNTTSNNVTALDSTTTSPMGTALTASSITEIAGAAITRHIHQTTGEFTPVANSAYTMSAWVKQPTTNPIRYVQLAFWVAGFGSTAYMNYDIQTGVVGTGGAGITSASIVAYPNGWYRISATATSLASPASSGFQLGFSTTSGAIRTEAYTVVTPLKSIFLWGAQVELGAFPTAYIPTTSAVLERSADVCSITGSNFTNIYNNSAGTFVSDSMIANLIGENRGIAQIDSGTSDNVIRHQYSSSIGGFNTLLRANVDTPTILSATAGAASTIQKRATAYAGTSFASTTNGGTVTTATRTFPVGLNTLRIGSLSTGSFVLNGHIARIQYFKKRLPDAKLQALTL